jgi:cysteine desulfurase / selenocysteine lyase
MLNQEDIQKKFSIEQIRKDFPFLKRKVNHFPLAYLDTSATAQKPQCVIESIVRYYSESNANIHRGVHTLSQEATAAYETARKSVRDFIHAESENEIIFTKGTTESINLVAHCLNEIHFEKGDEIILTELEHHSNILPWQSVAEKKGCALKVAAVMNSGELNIEHLFSLFSPKTKLLAITQVSNTLGTIVPVKKIIQEAKKHHVPVLIDGAQSIAHEKIDVQDLGCDFFVFSGHKLYAPTGIGVLYARTKWLERFPNYQTGGGTIESVSFEKTTYVNAPLRFEAGTPNIEAAIGLHAAIQYLKEIGIENIAQHEKEIIEYTISELKKVDGVILYSKATDIAGSISFNLEDIHPFDVGTILDKMGIAVRTGHHCTQPLMQRMGIQGTIRASVGIYTNKEEINRLLSGLMKAKKMLS